MTLTGTTSSVPSLIVVKSGGSRRLRARSDVVGLLQILDAHRLGHPAVAGRHGGLHHHAHAISAALHDAMACTVCRWL